MPKLHIKHSHIRFTK